MLHSIGLFSHGWFAGGNFEKIVFEIFEKYLQKSNEGRENKTPEMKGICASIVTDFFFWGKGVDCKSTENWLHVNCQVINDTE